jgi:hypothetical protein
VRELKLAPEESVRVRAHVRVPRDEEALEHKVQIPFTFAVHTTDGQTLPQLEEEAFFSMPRRGDH